MLRYYTAVREFACHVHCRDRQQFIFRANKYQTSIWINDKVDNQEEGKRKFHDSFVFLL